METQLGLDKVRLEKKELIAKLETNRKKHKQEYEKAFEGWRRKVIEEMSRNLELAKADKEWNLVIREPRPTDHTSDYDAVIALLKASIDEIVVLAVHEFKQYYLDEWTWQPLHKASVMNYVGTSMSE